MSGESLRPHWREVVSGFLKIGAMSYGGPAIMGLMQTEPRKNAAGFLKERFLEGLAIVTLLPGQGPRNLVSLKNNLTDPALQKLAVIVRAADTDRLDLAPQAPGLLAISLGLSRNIADDHEMLRHGMVLYDALYTWCQSAQGERHGWG